MGFEAFLDCPMTRSGSCTSRNPVSPNSSVSSAVISLPRLMRRSSCSRLWIDWTLVTDAGVDLGYLVQVRDRSDVSGCISDYWTD